jgi:hypothetical protein
MLNSMMLHPYQKLNERRFSDKVCVNLACAHEARSKDIEHLQG